MWEQSNKIPLIVKIITIFLFVISLFTEYYIEISVALIVFYILFFFFWNNEHPSVLLFSLSFMWLSITLGYFYVAFFKKDIINLLWYPYYSAEKINLAYWYSIFGLLFLSIGIRIAVGKSIYLKVNKKEIEKIDGFKLLTITFIYFIIASLFTKKIRYLIPSISEFFVMLGHLKWTLLLTASFFVFYKKKYLFIFWVFVLAGIISSFSNYFSDFKTYFFVIPIGYLTVRSLNFKHAIVIFLLSIITYILGVYWSYIKGDYRMFLSQGLKSQVVLVSTNDAIKKFFSYAKTFNIQKFYYGQEALIKRIFYLEFFSATLRNIPTYKPFMNGENILRAIRHVTMPRFLFPNKPALDDSRHTIELTSIFVAGQKQGVSISVAFFSELYADFGSWGLFISLFLLGLFVGLIYRSTILLSPSTMWGLALTFPIFFFIAFYEKDLVKLVGNLLWYIITIIIVRFTVLKYVISFVQKKIE